MQTRKQRGGIFLEKDRNAALAYLVRLYPGVKRKALNMNQSQKEVAAKMLLYKLVQKMIQANGGIQYGKGKAWSNTDKERTYEYYAYLAGNGDCSLYSKKRGSSEEGHIVTSLTLATLDMYAN